MHIRQASEWSQIKADYINVAMMDYDSPLFNLEFLHD